MFSAALAGFSSGCSDSRQPHIMEVRALCFRLVMNVLMVLVAHAQSLPQTDAAFRIVPTRLQLFEYGSVGFTCEGCSVSGCAVRHVKTNVKNCSKNTAASTVTCSIDFAFPSDSGEYWCEGGGGERSNTVNITVTAGHVILESPVLAVMEGDAATLSCRNKTSSISLPADFYKDGLFIGSRPTGSMSFQSVSEADGGLYRCNISGAGQSAESRLAVTGAGVVLESSARSVSERDAVTLRCRNKETPFDQKADFFKDGRPIGSSPTGAMTIHSVSKSDEGFYRCSISGAGESPGIGLTVTDRFSLHHDTLKWIVSVVLFLQLLVIGLLYWKKQLVLLEIKLNEPKMDTYAVVKKDRKKKKKRKEEEEDAADNLSFGLDTNYSAQPQTGEPGSQAADEAWLRTFGSSAFTDYDTSPALQKDDDEQETPY